MARVTHRTLALFLAALVAVGQLDCAAAARRLLQEPAILLQEPPSNDLAPGSAAEPPAAAAAAPLTAAADCARIPGCRACEPGAMVCTACEDGYALKDGLCVCAAGYGSYAVCPPGAAASPACASFPQKPSDTCPVAIGFGLRLAKDCLCQPCPPGTTSPGGEITTAMCAPPPVLGSELARSASAAALMGAAIANSYQPRCVMLRVRRGALAERANGFACTLGEGDRAVPECVPDAEALADNFPATGCAEPVIPLLSAAERLACREALKYPYSGEAYTCSLMTVNYKAWADEGFAPVQCCVKPANSASAAVASPDAPEFQAVSQAAVPAIDLSQVPLSLQLPAYDASFATPLGDLQLRAAAVPLNFGADISLEQTLADLALQPGRFVGRPAFDEAQLVNLTQSEIASTCEAEYGAQCTAELAAAGADIDRAHAERAAADAAAAGQTALKLAMLMAPQLTASYERPRLGAVAGAGAEPAAPAARVLAWQFESLMGGLNATGGWAPGAGTSDSAFHLLLAADELLAAAGNGGLDQVGFDAARGVVVSLGAVPARERVSALTNERVETLANKIQRLRQALTNPTVESRALDYIARANKLHKNAERLAKVMGKAEDFTKVVQKISSGIVKRAVGILSKVLRTSEANAEKIVKVAKRVTEAALKIRKVTKLLSLQLPVLELQANAGRALVCVLDTARGAADTTASMAKIDEYEAARAYMRSLEVAEQVVGAQVQVIEMLERALDELSVMKPLEELIATVGDVLCGVVDALVDPILSVLKKAVCIRVWGWEKCLSLQDVLEGVSRLFRFLLGWAEDLINALLEPVWRPVEAWVRKLFDMLVPDFGLDWFRLPAIPELPFYNFDHLLHEIRLKLVTRIDTKLTPRKDLYRPAAHDYKKDPMAGWGVAVGIWRGRVVCYSKAACGGDCDDSRRFWGNHKCASTPWKVWGGKQPARTWHDAPFSAKLDEYERDRARAAAGALDAAAGIDRRVSALACDGGGKEGQACREYLRLLAISALPPACQQIIDTLAGK